MYTKKQQIKKKLQLFPPIKKKYIFLAEKGFAPSP